MSLEAEEEYQLPTIGVPAPAMRALLTPWLLTEARADFHELLASPPATRREATSSNDCMTATIVLFRGCKSSNADQADANCAGKEWWYNYM
jgi:hypothetical protein